MTSFTPNAYYVGVGFLFLSSIVDGLCVLFVCSGFLGLYHRIRKDQDRTIVYMITTMSILALLHASMTLSSQYKPDIPCSVAPSGSNAFYFTYKVFFFVFLARKASMVQYSDNAGRKVFICDYLLIAFYGLFSIALMVIPGLLHVGMFTDAKTGIYLCVINYSSSLPSVSLIVETALNFINLYMFLKPLRAHKRSMTFGTGNMSANSRILGEVMKKNMTGSTVSIVFTIFAHSFSIINSALFDDYGVSTANFSLVVLEETVSLVCCIMLCHNSWDIPCLQKPSTAKTGHVSMKESTDLLPV